jgi:hemoglobin-like flavoprotein
MTPEQINIVKMSFAKVAPISEEAAAIFYCRLFEIAPDIKPLFRGDMTQQGRMLMAALAAVVNGLSNLEIVLPAASALAKRHVAYGVKADHYGPVGAALLWTLERGLGADWTPQVADAWTAAYTALTSYMIGQAYGPSLAAA